MNYTKTLRAYCQQNKGKIFDTGKMAEDYFPMIPYKTMLRVMNRLEEEGLVTTVSKGVYYIVDESQDIDSAILECYVNNGHGIVAGDAMLHELGVINDEPEHIDIYTNMISPNHKTIGKYHMTKADIHFGKDECNLIRLLEVIEKGSGLNRMDPEKLSDLLERGANSYIDWIFKAIVSHIDYGFATIVTLTEALQNAGKNDVLCLDIYSDYRINK